MSAFQKGNWLIEVSDCGDYIHLSRAGLPGTVSVKSDFEGYVVDIWQSEGPEDSSPPASCAGTLGIMYKELVPEEE